MHQHFRAILRLNPNFGLEDVTDDSRALKLASSGEYLHSKKNKMKAIVLDDNFFTKSNTANFMVDMFEKLDSDIESRGFVEFFKHRVERGGCFKAQAFLLNVFINNEISIRDFKIIQNGSKTIGIGLECQPREIVLFHYAVEMCRLHSLHEGDDLELLLHAIFPYRNNDWISEMITCHYDRNNGSPGYILEEVGHNGLVRIIFKYLVSQSAEETVSYYQLVEYKST